MRFLGIGKKTAQLTVTEEKQFHPPLQFKSSSHVSYLFNAFGSGISNAFLAPQTAYNMYYGIAPLQSAVSKVSNAIGELPLVTRREDEPDEIIKESEVLDILNNPSTTSTKKQFRIDCAISLMLTRELWIQVRGMPNGKILEMEYLYPYSIQTVMDTTNIWPARIYTNIPGNRIWYDREEIDGRFRYIDRTGLNELYPYIAEKTPTFRGISPLTAVKDELLGYSASIVGNTASIENSQNPSGIISPKDPNITSKQWEDLQESVDETVGPENRGKTILLPVGVEATFPQWAPKDMEYSTLQHNTKLSVWNLYSIPLPIVSGEGQTYSNFGEAQTAFYDEAVNEVTSVLFDAFKWILETRFEMTGITISYNQFEVPALRRRAIEQMEKLQKSNAISTNEIRKSAGFEENINGEDIMIPSGFTPLSAAVIAPTFDMEQTVRVNDSNINNTNSGT